VAQDAGGGAGAIAAGADGAFRVLTNPATGFELKANLVSLQRTALQAFEPLFSRLFSHFCLGFVICLIFNRVTV
jgi:hypothetical protein